MNKALVSIIVVNYNCSDQILDLFDSLSYSTYTEYEIIIVDNASTNDDLEYFKENALLSYKLIQSADNLGFAGGNNLGIREAKGDYMLLLNPDVIVEEKTIERLVHTLDHSLEIAVVSPKIYYYNQPNYIQYAGCEKMHPISLQTRAIGKQHLDRGQFDQPGYTAYAHGAAMMFRKSVVEEVGEMQEAYFLYYEELDYCHRILEAGYKIYYQAKAKVFHKESMSTGKQSPLKTYYLNRNRLLFARLNYNFIQRLLAFSYIFFISFPKQVWVRRNQGDHLKAYCKAIFWHVLNWNLNL